MAITSAPRVPVIPLCALLNGVGGGLGWSILPPLLGKIGGELGLTPTLAGVVWGAAPLGIALAAPLGGALADRFGARRTAGLAMLFGAAACAARALTVGPWSLALAMLAFGLHIGFVCTAIPKALAVHIPVTRLARANGLALLAYTLTTAGTILIARDAAAWIGGWRPLMVAVGGLMALAGVVWLAAYRDVPEAVVRKHAALRDVFAAARHPGLLKVAAMHFLLFGGYLALLGILPRALLAGGISPAKVGYTIAGWLVVAALANGVGPWLSDRIGARRPILIGGALVAGGALLLLALLPAAAAPILLPIAALGGGMVAPLILALPVELPGIGPARAGTALGLLMLVGQMGGFLLPIISGAAGAQALLVLAGAHLLIAVPAAALGGTARPAAATAQPVVA